MQYKRLIIFLLLMMLMAFIVDRLGYSVINYFYGETRSGYVGGKLNFYLNDENSPRAIILGNSRALRHINPDSLDIPFYNLAHPGMDDGFQNALLSILISEEKTPDLILFHIEPYEYYGAPEDSTFVSLDIKQLKPYYFKNYFVRENLNGISAFEFLKYKSRLYQFNGILFDIMINYFNDVNDPIVNNNGFEALSSATPFLGDSIVTKQGYDFKFDSERLDFQVAKTVYLRQLIKVCADRDIELICTTSPYFINDDVAHQSSKKYLDSLFKTHHIPYLDNRSTNLPPLLQKPEVWADGTHFNAIGAAHYSRLVGRQLREVDAEIE